MATRASMPMINKRTGKPLAPSTIRRKLVHKLKSLGFKIKRTGDPLKVVAVSSSAEATYRTRCPEGKSE